MEVFSILNDVLGSIMRGPSSSHTAGSYRIGSLVRSLSGGEPSRVEVTFDPEGSLAPTYVPLGVDIAFVAGVMGWSMLDGIKERELTSVAIITHFTGGLCAGVLAHGLFLLFG